MSKEGFVPSIKESEIKEGQMKPLHIKGKSILLVRQAGQVFAVLNRCTHMGCTFEGGILRDYLVICPCHGWEFDVRNGQYTENKQTTIQCYRCKIQNGKIFVEIEKHE